MSQNKMTLQEYIESRNYKRRISSKSKSKKKLLQHPQTSQLKLSIHPSLVTENTESKNQNKQQYNPQMSQLVRQIKQIDQSVQGFSRIHRKVQDIKQFAREYIHDDKIFVSFCKSLFQLQGIYRLELIQAYRFQLFKFQYQNENNFDQHKKRMLKQLNENYMNSKFQYKTIILKEKNQLTKSQKLVLQQVIQTQGKFHANKNNNYQSLVVSSQGGLNQNLLKQPVLQKKKMSFLETFIPATMSSSIQLKNDNVPDSNFILVTSYTTIDSNPEVPTKDKVGIKEKSPVQYTNFNKETNIQQQKSNIKPTNAFQNRGSNILKQPQKQILKDQVEVKINSFHPSKSPGAKKVIFLPHQSIRQTATQYAIPDFQPKKQSLKSNPEQQLKIVDQSDIAITPPHAQSSSGGSSQIQNNQLLSLLQRQSSKQQKQKKLALLRAKQYKQKALTPKKSRSPDPHRKKSTKQIQEDKQRQKLLQSKDYLRVKKK